VSSRPDYYGQHIVYPDNYADPLKNQLQLTRQSEKHGNLLTSNPETSCRNQEQLAAAARLCPYYSAVQSAAGLPPHQYVIARRVERAKQLL
jgi:hypothetical protein